MVSGTMCRGFDSLQMRFVRYRGNHRAHLTGERNVMDNFREWLSDNLRYILLGLAILLVLAVIIFGVWFVSGRLGGGSKEPADATPQVEDTGNETDQTNDQDQEPEATPEAESEPEDALEQNAYPKVNALVEKYYTALGGRDTETLKTLVDNLDPSEETAIENSRYIESYSGVEAYTKPGTAEGSYVVLAVYDHKYTGYDTVLPGVSCMYVDTGDDGELYIVSEPTAEQQARIDEVTNSEDVQALITEKQQEYDDTVASDPELASYLAELGVEMSAAMSAEDGATITVKSNCNVRSQPSTDAEKLGELTAGQQVTKTGSEGDWIQIDFEGQTGYVRGDLFQ